MGKTMTNFLEVIKRFRSEGKTNIAIFKPHSSLNKGLYSDLCRELSSKGCAMIVDRVFLQSYEAMKKNLVDILVVPELSELDYFDFGHIWEFVHKGGALILSGSDLFMRSRTFKGTLIEMWVKDETELTFYRKTVAHLGIKPYIADVSPNRVKIDGDFVQGVPKGLIDIEIPPIGAKFNTSSDVRDPAPICGTAFPERYEVLRNYEVVTGCDELGRRLNAAVTFAQNWETGARLCLFASNAKGSFMDSKMSYFSPLLDAAARFCQKKVMISFCMPDYACYRDGEHVRVKYAVKSYSIHPEKFSVEVMISGGEDKYLKVNSHEASAGEELMGEVFWMPLSFKTDYYNISVRVISDGKLISKAENGFVVWKKDVIARGPNIAVDGEYFTLNGKRTVLTGINYYESHLGSSMWVRPNVAKLRADLEEMARFGINYLRIHYHHAKWFYDYYMNAAGVVPEQYREFGDSYLPTETILRTFDAHIYLCQRYGIIYGGDLFTLRPEEMGDPRGWISVQDYMWIEEKFECQKEFLKLLIPRYTEVPAVAWDIYNEPLGSVDEAVEEFNAQFNLWASKIKAYMRELGDTHPITVGDLFGTDTYTNVADYLSPHGNFRKAASLKVDSGKPEIFQEVWIERPFTPEGDMLQLGDMKQALTDTFRTGLAGFAPWQWTAQLCMWQDEGTFAGENWDDYLGCCVRHDGTIKPSGRFYSDFITLIGDLEFLKSTKRQITTDKGILIIKSAQEVSRGDHYCILSNGGSVLRGVARGCSENEDYRVTADKGCDVWFRFCEDNGKSDYVKADGPCRLFIRTTREPKEVALCDRYGTNLELQVPFRREGGGILVDIIDWQVYYWLKLQY